MRNLREKFILTFLTIAVFNLAVPAQEAERPLNGGETHSYTIRLKRGEYFHVEVEQRGIDVLLALVGPDGETIIERDRPNGKQGAESLSFIATTPGDYRLDVKALEPKAEAGRYEITIDTPRMPGAQDKSRVIAETLFQEGSRVSEARTPESQKQACEKYSAAAALWQELGDKYAEALTQNSLGYSLSVVEEFEKAIVAHERALELYQALHQKLDQAVSLEALCILNAGSLEPAKAIAQFEQARQLYRSLQTIADEKRLQEKFSRAAQAYLKAGIELFQKGEAPGLRRALVLFAAAREMFSSLADNSNEALALLYLGRISGAVGKRQPALDYYTDGLRLYKGIGDAAGQGICLHNIGNWYQESGDTMKALDYYNQALPLRRVAADQEGEAATLLNMGSAYSSLGDNQKAIEYLSQALPLMKASGFKYGEAKTLHDLGAVYSILGDKRNSLDFYTRALALRRAIEDKEGESVTLRGIADVYDDLNDKQKALDYYLQAEAVLKVLGDTSNEAKAINEIGLIYSSLGEKRKALEYYLRSLALTRESKDAHAEATAVNNIGRVYSDLGEKQKALEYYSQALSLYETTGDKAGEAVTLNNTGRVYADLGDKQKAIDYYNRSLALNNASGGPAAGKAIIFNNLANAYESLGDRRRALEYFNQALPLMRVAGDKSSESRTLSNMGNLFAQLGDKPKALEYYNEALLPARAVGDRASEASTYNNLGALYSSTGGYRNALKHYQDALRLERAIGDKHNEAKTLGNIGGVFRALGEWQKALEYFKESLSLVSAVGDASGKAVVLSNIGVIYAHLGDQKKALEQYDQALSLTKAVGDKRSEAMVLNNIGFVYGEADDNLKALEYYTQSFELMKKLGNIGDEGTTLGNVCQTYASLGDYRKALECHSQAVVLERAAGDKAAEAGTLNNIMIAWYALGNARLAAFYGKQSLSVYHELRGNAQGMESGTQKAFLRTMQYRYRNLAYILVDQGRYAEAQQVLNAFKDEQYFDFNREQMKPPSALALTQREAVLTERYGAVSDRIGSGGIQLEELKLALSDRMPNSEELAKLQQREADLKNATDEFLAFLKQLETDFSGQPDLLKDKSPDVADTREIQAALRQLNAQTKEKAVAIYTVVGGDRFTALIVAENDIAAVSSPIKEGELNGKAEQFWGLLQQTNYDPKVLAQELYADIFKPIEARLPKDTTTIMWSLDGNLRYIPMAALHDGKQYLVARYNHVVFTRADSGRLVRDVSGNWTGLGMGSSQAQSVKVGNETIHFGSLPGVAAEMQAIFKRKDTKGGIFAGEVLQDEKFTRESMLRALKMKRPLVHISSHFSFTPGDESLSFLVLGDGTSMSLSDIKQQTEMFGGVELLTLSACNTAAQKEGANGREIDGFAELTQRLGAAAVMATLWEVADHSTPLLMREFYKAVQQQSMNKVRALRQAQMDLLNGSANTTSMPATQKGTDEPAVKIIVISEGDKPRSDQTRSSERVVKIENKYAQPFKLDPEARFAHPYFWSPFVLFGNWK